MAQVHVLYGYTYVCPITCEDFWTVLAPGIYALPEIYFKCREPGKHPFINGDDMMLFVWYFLVSSLQNAVNAVSIYKVSFKFISSTGVFAKKRISFHSQQQWNKGLYNFLHFTLNHKLLNKLGPSLCTKYL